MPKSLELIVMIYNVKKPVLSIGADYLRSELILCQRMAKTFATPVHSQKLNFTCTLANLRCVFVFITCVQQALSQRTDEEGLLGDIAKAPHPKPLTSESPSLLDSSHLNSASLQVLSVAQFKGNWLRNIFSSLPA